MPNIAEKSKVFGGNGVVLSFTRAPDVFLYRELILGTKKYRYKVIDGANTLEATIDKSLDAYNALRNNFQRVTGEIMEKDKQINEAKTERDALTATRNALLEKKRGCRNY